MNKLTEKDKVEIREVISKASNVPLEGVTDSSKLHSDLGMDSIDAVEVIMELEEKYNIIIPDSDFEAAETVGNIIELVEQQIEQS